MGAPFPSNLLSHKETVPSMPALARRVSVNFKLTVLSVLTVEKRIWDEGSCLLMISS